ncbi:hypothetical protein J2Y69_002950 [Microbacterium resistens]|uniref:Secreted protein n=1 Tax=Microbacterium resistens TaxID=156977 RepID=A0ABU1SFH1_9MICO|nr:hypothetical protein [Microbacterium resistens]MDR6868336.1 hypothetical protein [Microbacterium resistens]
MRNLGKLSIAAVVVAALTTIAAPAYAADGNEAPPPPREDIQTQLDAIENPDARAGAESMVAELVAQGRDVVAVDAGTYVPVADAAEGQMSPMGMPTDCHASLTISRSGQNIFNDVKSWCSVSFTKVQHHMSIMGQNPWVPPDTNTVADNWYTTYSTTTAWNTQVFACNNYNMTDWRAYGSGALERGGVVYTIPTLQDVMDYQDCGW